MSAIPLSRRNSLLLKLNPPLITSPARNSNSFSCKLVASSEITDSAEVLTDGTRICTKSAAKRISSLE